MFIYYVFDKRDGFILKSFFDEDEMMDYYNDLISHSECFLPISFVAINFLLYPEYNDRMKIIKNYCFECLDKII